ncbi:MAG: cyclic pyranopterin monophosphate synthase MoaC [Bacteroidales bacterium]|jgi:cyclic pyranopterin phosphate synthase
MGKLSHTKEDGSVNMVDITQKEEQFRKAIASGSITLNSETIELVKNNQIKKGSVLTAAQIAGIMAAKKCSDIIPLCHPISLTSIDVETTLTESGVKVVSTAICNGKTGVEMEALTAVSAALLCIYDMCKAVDKKMVINDIKLIEKIKL